MEPLTRGGRVKRGEKGGGEVEQVMFGSGGGGIVPIEYV